MNINHQSYVFDIFDESTNLSYQYIMTVVKIDCTARVRDISYINNINGINGRIIY